MQNHSGIGVRFHSCMQLPKLVDGQKLRSEAQRVLTRARQGRRQPADALPGDSELVAALLTWCQAVCSAHGLAIHNFRTSFADARGLCWLVSSSALKPLCDRLFFAVAQSVTITRSIELTISTVTPVISKHHSTSNALTDPAKR